jgi:hypothetical protein
MREPMKTIYRFGGTALTALLLMLMAYQSAEGQTEYKKLAQTGMKFLAVSGGARQAALADAFTAVEGASSSMFYNTATMANLEGFADAWLSSTQWIADIKHYYAAAAISPWNGDYGVLGVSIQYVNYGEVQRTVFARNDKGYLDLGVIHPSAYAIGISYAKSLTERFSVGGSVKLVHQYLGQGALSAGYVQDADGKDIGTTDVTLLRAEMSVPAFDFGILYKTGFKSLAFGMTVRNFAREVAYVRDKFQLPLTFRIGVAMNMFDLLEMDKNSQRLLLALEAEHPRDYPEQTKVGLEYVFANTVSLRLGYISPADEHTFSYGLGLQQEFMGTRVALDYAYTPFGIFDGVQRLSFHFGL